MSRRLPAVRTAVHRGLTPEERHTLATAPLPAIRDYGGHTWGGTGIGATYREGRGHGHDAEDYQGNPPDDVEDLE